MRNPSRVAALWWDYSFAEGWAHYAEEMMYDAGLGRDQPEMRVGMLTNALLRDVRFLSAICLHTGCMTLEESEKMFREQAFADAGNARQQALRGTYDPGYLAYTLGKLMIRKLRSRLARGESGRNAPAVPRPFLSYGVAAGADGARADARYRRRGALSPANYRIHVGAVRRVRAPQHCDFLYQHREFLYGEPAEPARVHTWCSAGMRCTMLVKEYVVPASACQRIPTACRHTG